MYPEEDKLNTGPRANLLLQESSKEFDKVSCIQEFRLIKKSQKSEIKMEKVKLFLDF